MKFFLFTLMLCSLAMALENAEILETDCGALNGTHSSEDFLTHPELQQAILDCLAPVKEPETVSRENKNPEVVSQ